MVELGVYEIAAACAGRLVAGAPDAAGPLRASIDSRAVAPGDLFFGIRGERSDGGAFAEAALEAGAWGVVAAPEHAQRAAATAAGEARVIEAPDPLAALAGVARRWGAELAARGCRTVGITGSVGKTSTKDILVSLLRPLYR